MIALTTRGRPHDGFVAPKVASITLPDHVRETLHHFRTAEFTSTGKDGTPVTGPVCVSYLEAQEQFLLTTCIGLPGKLHNIRRDPRVALSYSDATGSKLTDPTFVVVQGIATIDESIRTSVEGLEDYWRDTVFARQPKSQVFGSNAVMRWLMDWYYMRHVIIVNPVRITWWLRGDVFLGAQTIELIGHVA
jgi:hypothetical protein